MIHRAFISNRCDFAITRFPPWIERYLMAKGIKINPDASAMLTEFLGTDLHKIVNELDKLLITLPEGKPRYYYIAD